MATYYVDPASGSDGNAGTSWGLAKASLQGAIDIADGGDTINVANTADDDLGGTEINWTSFGGGTPTVSQILPLIIQGANPGAGTITIDHPDGDIDAGSIDGEGLQASIFASSGMPSSSYFYFKNMIFKNITGSLFNSGSTPGNFCSFYQCKFENCDADTTDGVLQTRIGWAVCDCWFTEWNNSFAAIELNAQDSLISGCFFDARTSGGFCIRGTSMSGNVIINNLMHAGNQHAIDIENRSVFIVGNTIKGNGTNSKWGINENNSGSLLCFIYNNIFVDWSGTSGGGINYGTGGNTVSGPNLFYNCTSDESSRFTGISLGNDVSADPGFASAANLDFNPSEQDNAKEAGHPVGIIGTSSGAATGTTSYVDLGLAQRQEPAGGGVGPLPRMVVSGRRPVY